MKIDLLPFSLSISETSTTLHESILVLTRLFSSIHFLVLVRYLPNELELAPQSFSYFVLLVLAISIFFSSRKIFSNQFV